ncbi:MAG: hypothetical protein U1F67_10435 [Rubrivivax sp.]
MNNLAARVSKLEARRAAVESAGKERMRRSAEVDFAARVSQLCTLAEARRAAGHPVVSSSDARAERVLQIMDRASQRRDLATLA